jgi:uncharacterized protein YuzE
MKLRTDKAADALYLRLTESKVVESERLAPGVIVDFDKHNQVVGIEVLNVSQRTRPVPPRVAHAKSPALVREKRTKYRA